MGWVQWDMRRAKVGAGATTQVGLGFWFDRLGFGEMGGLSGTGVRGREVN